MRQAYGGDLKLYFAFSGRFGQYVGTRNSEPVVTKRFNPNLFVRYFRDRDREESMDFVIGHESNGQSITTPAEYQTARDAASAAGDQPDNAKDAISRGWDYLGWSWRKIPWRDPGVYRISTQVELRYFLPRGPFQKTAEEYNSWEDDPQGKRRSAVNGIAGTVNYYNEQFRLWQFEEAKFSLAFETGYRDPLRYNTLRVEAGCKLFDLPLVLWAQTGYGSDLAQYYKRVNTIGLAIEVGSL
jgi:outer membrane phospholipase A